MCLRYATLTTKLMIEVNCYNPNKTNIATREQIKQRTKTTNTSMLHKDGEITGHKKKDDNVLSHIL